MNGKTAKLIRKALGVNAVNKHAEDVREMYQHAKQVWRQTPRDRRTKLHKELEEAG